MRPLLGRQDELRALHEALARAAAGDAETVLLAGDVAAGNVRVLASDRDQCLDPADVAAAVAADRAAAGRLPACVVASAGTTVSTHRVDDRTVLRLCAINPRTTRADVERALDRLVCLAARPEE